MQQTSIKDYQILYTPREDQYDEILKLASLNLGCKYAALSLKSDSGFWLKAKMGFLFEEISYSDSFWKYHTGKDNELFFIPNTKIHPGLRDNPLVVSKPNIISYVGTPIIDFDGQLLGVLSVFSDTELDVSDEQKSVLNILSKQVLRLLKAGKEEKQLKNTTVELLETKNKLIESEKYFKSLIDNAGDLFYEIGPNGKFIYVNRQFEKISGYSWEEVIGLDYWVHAEKSHAKDLKEFYKNQHIEKESISYYEFPITSKSGKRIWLGQSVKMDFSNSRNVKTIVVARDITQQKEIDIKLNKYKNGLRLINYISSNNQFSVDEQIDMALEVGRNYLGLDIGLIGQIKNDQYKLKYERIDSTNSTLKFNDEYSLKYLFCELTFKKNDIYSVQNIGESELKDHPFYKESKIESYIGIPYTLKGKITGVISFHSLQPREEPFDENEIDFIRLFAKWVGFTLETEANKSSLLSEQDILKSFATFSPAAIAMFNNQMEYIAVTEKWRKDNGLAELDIIGKNHYLVEGDVKDEWEPLHKKALEGEIVKIENDSYFNWKKEKRHLRWEARPWFDTNNEIAGIIIFTEDITELKRNENELKQAKILAEKASAAKDQFLSTMSHEIRTPLNAVIGASHLLLLENPREDQKENINLLKNSGEHLLALVNDILDFSKIEEGKLRLEETHFDFKKLLHTVKNTLRYHADDKNISLKWSGTNEVPEVILGDPTRLSQILINLLGNAIKFTDKGFVELKITLQKDQKTKAQLLFEVIDTGIGISSKKRDSIFNTFTQADADTTRKYGGSGLGLSITKKLLEMMKSKIQVKSTLGEGSNFSFKLTVKKGDFSHLEVTQVVGKSTILNENKKILLVEDNEVNRILATKFLTKWGLTVECAENGLICLDKIKQRDFDLILMDLQMPEMDGYEATKRLRNSGDSYFENIPIIALTAAAFIEAQQQVKEVGMNDFVTKPFHPREFREKMEKYLQISVREKY